jgi:tetratricopeptide (TPR) repeat protein
MTCSPSSGVWLTRVIFLLLLLFQSVHCLPKACPTQLFVQHGAALSEQHLKVFEEVLRLNRNKDFKGAIEKLKDIANADGASPPVLVLMGDLHAQLEEFARAVAWYNQAIRFLGSREADYPVNVRLKAGVALYLLKRHREAITELERAWRHPRYQPDDTTVYDMLAEAYEAIGARNKAYQTYLTSIAADPGAPEVWSAIRRIRPNGRQGLSSAVGAGVPRPPTAKHFAEVVAAGDPLKWTWRDVEAGVLAYIAFSAELKAAKHHISSERYLNVAALAALKIGANSFSSHRYDDTLRALSLADRARPLNTLDAEAQRHADVLLLMTHGRLGQFIHGVAAAERLLDSPSPPEHRKIALELLNRFLRKVYNSVSWDEASNHPRENDPDDFLGDMVPLNSTVATTRGQKPSPVQGGPIPVAEMPYGMTSPDEDLATLIGQRINESVLKKEDYNDLIKSLSQNY